MGQVWMRTYCRKADTDPARRRETWSKHGEVQFETWLSWVWWCPHPYCHPRQTANLCPDPLICVTRTRRMPKCLAQLLYQSDRIKAPYHLLF